MKKEKQPTIGQKLKLAGRILLSTFTGDNFWALPDKIKPAQPLNPDMKNPRGNIPVGRQSEPDFRTNVKTAYDTLEKGYKVVTPDFEREVIPLIRKLVKVNPDFGQALQNIVFLGNTGHRIHFDKTVSEEERTKMRRHIQNKHKQWASGQAGIDGLVNRMFSQVMIAGALSNEWVPNEKLTGIEANIMVNPENITWVLDNRRKTTYIPFQKVYHPSKGEYLKQLNTNTYQYYALNGDGEDPYGYPPYMTALDATETQENMNKNIGYVVKQLGLLGFLECLITEPEQKDGEDDATYIARVQSLLDQAKTQIDAGFKSGSIVGLEGQHTFKYNSIAKDFDRAVELFKQNELQMASGLKQDATLWGRDYNSSESQITVVFMKMLAEMKNIQNVVKCNLEFGYTLELRLAGFKFDYLTVEFNKSTIQDDLKYQQALEYKIKNVTSMYILGIYNITQVAHELNVEDPDQDEPRVSDEALAGIKAAVESNHDNQVKDGAKGSKNKSAKKQRDKDKPQGSKKS